MIKIYFFTFFDTFIVCLLISPAEFQCYFVAYLFIHMWSLLLYISENQMLLLVLKITLSWKTHQMSLSCLLRMVIFIISCCCVVVVFCFLCVCVCVTEFHLGHVDAKGKAPSAEKPEVKILSFSNQK